MDEILLPKGQEETDLPQTYVIFVVENGEFAGNEMKQWFIRKDKSNGKALEDGTNILYVNASYHDTNTEFGRLMNDLHCADPDEMYYEVLANVV